MKHFRFAILGAGFWSQYQLAAWGETKQVECVAIYNRTRSKAEALAAKFNVPQIYDDAEELLRREKLDFIDVITDVDSHSRFVHLAAKHQVPVICQKPLAPTLPEAERMVDTCRKAGVPLLVHENWRWQAPIRAVQNLLAGGAIGTPFRARIDMISGFPVFKNQPFLKDLPQFILTDLGTHILDVARCLFGEAASVYCQSHRVHPDIKGEDVATVMMKMGPNKTTVLCEMAYAENPLEREVFPQTLMFVEGDKGSLEIGPDYWLRITTAVGTSASRVAPTHYPWVDPAYAVVQSSIVDCHFDLLRGLSGTRSAETTGEDNLRTLRLVFAAYESATADKVIGIKE
jgi:predicted dehydrogenase